MSDLVGVRIHLDAYDVWQFFEENVERLGKEMVCIAENVDTGYNICLEEKSGIPFFKVFRDEEFEYGEAATCGLECREVTKKLYWKYLFPITVVEDRFCDFPQNAPESDDYPFDKDPEDPEEQIQILDDIVYERDDELNMASMDFLATLLNVTPDEVELMTYEGFCADFVKKVGEMLAEECNISIYHPVWMPADETGYQHYNEYPYLDIDGEGVVVGEPSDFGDFDFTGIEDDDDVCEEGVEPNAEGN